MSDQVFEFPKITPPKLSMKLILMGVAVLVVLVILLGSFYQVQPEEVGLILRFGKHVRTTGPGLHLKMPFAENVLKVPVQRQLKQEFGFSTVQAPGRSRRGRQFEGESLMLTGDLNVAVVEWIVQYRIVDPYRYLFRVRHLDEASRSRPFYSSLLHDMNEAVMREVVGDRTVTEVLTVGRQEIESIVEQKLQELSTQYEMGITIDQVVLQNVTPPGPVKPSWDEVNQAEQQRDQLMNEARAAYNKVIPRAQGEAQQAILQAQGYSLNRVNHAEGDAARFNSLYEAYRKAPEVTRRRMYLETMQKVLPRLGGKLFLDENADGVMPLLPLGALSKILTAEPERGAAQ
jgi:membrane protease subunit HflK